jgi:hypothetical protein
MLHKAKVAIYSEINKKYLNTVWVEFTILFAFFKKFRKAIISFIKVVRLSVNLHGATLLPVGRFS